MKKNTKYDQFLIAVGKNIKKHREAHDFTQERLSELTGIEYKYYQSIEYGKANLTIKTILKLCSALDLDPKKLFDVKWNRRDD